jgi:hypothetical protein
MGLCSMSVRGGIPFLAIESKLFESSIYFKMRKEKCEDVARRLLKGRAKHV